MGLIQDNGYVVLNLKVMHDDLNGDWAWGVRYELEYYSKRERKILKYKDEVNVWKNIYAQNKEHHIYLMEDNLQEIDEMIFKIEGTTEVRQGKTYCIIDK